MALKRILSFGGRKAAANREIDDSNKLGKKNMVDTSGGLKSPTSPQHQTKIPKYPNLNLSDKKDKRGLNKEPVAENRGGRKIPNVLSAGSIKAPFHHKYALDSSNELSGEVRLR